MGAFIGAIDTFWYTRLDEAIPGADGSSVVKKVLLDQIIWSPVCCSTFFFGIIISIKKKNERIIVIITIFFVSRNVSHGR